MALKRRRSRVGAAPTCPLSHCMTLLKGAWAVNVLWYLSEGPRRFGELRSDIPRVSAKVLSTRLRELEQRGLVTRELVDSSPPTAEYALTDLGYELIPALKAIVHVGTKLRDA